MKRLSLLPSNQSSRFMGLWLSLILIVMLGMNGWGQSITTLTTGNWNNVNTWLSTSTLQGTISTLTSSTNVIGNNTNFTTQLSIGGILTNSSGIIIGTIKSINSTTSITLTTNAATTNNNITYKARIIPLSRNDVIIANNIDITLLENESCASLTLNGTNGNKDSRIYINNSTLDVLGNITCSGGSYSGIIINSGKLNIGGNWQNGGSFTHGTGTVNYNGNSAQLVGNYLYYNLSISNTGSAGSNTVTLTDKTTVANDLTLTSGILDVSEKNYDLTVNGNWTNNVSNTAFNGRTNIVSFSGSTQTINGTASTTFSSLVISPSSTTTMSINNTCFNLVFSSSVTGTAAVLTHSGSSTLTVTGSVTINQPGTSFTNAWNINTGSATVSGLITFSGTNLNINKIGKINITTGTLNANGGIIFHTGNSACHVIDMSTGGGTGTLNLKGTLTVPANSSTLTAGTSDSNFNYIDANAQTINFFSAGAYNNLLINNTSGASLSGAINNSNVTGNISVGSLNPGSLFSTNNNAIALAASKSLKVESNSTFNAGTSVISFGTNGVATINGTFKLANLNGFSGNTTTSINSTNPPTINLGDNSTIEYNASANQAVTPRTYSNLALSVSGTKTFGNSATITGKLSISDHAIADLGSSNSTAGSLTLEGSVQNKMSWGSTNSTANNKNITYFGSTATGILNPCPTITATISGTNAICAGSSAHLTVSISGGFSPYTITYSGGTANNYISGIPISVSPTSTTTYNITSVTDANGCLASVSGSAVVTVNPILTPTISIAITTGGNPTCSGSSITFTATSNNGGTAPSYQWKLNGNNSGTGLTYTHTSPNNNDKVTCVMTSNATCTSSPTAISNEITITFNGNATLSLSSGHASPTVCINNAITSIVYSVAGAGTGASITSGTLPNGVTGTYNPGAKTFTISGTPTAIGSFPFIVTTSGSSCTNPSLGGTIVANALPNPPTAGSNQSITYGVANPNLSASAAIGETVDWYDAPTGGNNVAIASTACIPTQTNAGVYIYYAEAINTTTGCVSSSRTAVRLTINAKKLTITANSSSKTYGTIQAAQVIGSTAFTPVGLVNDETIGSITLNYVTGTAATDAVGAYAGSITPSTATGGTFTATNYNITSNPGTLTVTPKVLTITANSQTKCSGATFTFAGNEYTSNGLTNSDAIASVSFTSTGAAAEAAEGTYPIVPSIATGIGLGNYTIGYVNGTFTVTPKQWTGTTNTDWSNGGNWCSGIAPTSLTNVVISKLTNSPVISAITAADCNNLTIGPGASLTINSDATHSGSLIVKGNSTGNITYNRWMDHIGDTYSRWYIMSAPVNVTSGFDANAIKIHQDATVTPKVYDFATYTESANDWSYVSDIPTSLDAGKGYLISLNPASDGITQFTGALNNEPITPIVSTSANNGWNAVGNPYTSAIKVIGTDGFLNVNTSNLNPNYAAIYVWNEDAAYTGTQQYYRVIGNSGYIPAGAAFSVISETNIQAGQGFLIHSNGTNPTVSFNKAMQVHQTDLTLKSSNVSWPGITLLAQSGGQERSTVVAFNERMSTSLDVSYDAGLLSTDSFKVYTHLVGGSKAVDFAIQCLPGPYSGLSVPVGVDLPQGGTLAFKASGIVLPKGLYPVIEDKELGMKKALKTGTDSYAVTLARRTRGTGRFYLTIEGADTRDPEVVLQKKYTASLHDRRITINGAAGEGTKARLFDLGGRKVEEYPLLNTGRNEIVIPDSKQKVYLLRIDEGAYSQTLKLVSTGP